MFSILLYIAGAYWLGRLHGRQIIAQEKREAAIARRETALQAQSLAMQLDRDGF